MEKPKLPSCFKQHRAGTRTGIGSFEQSLYEAFYKADPENRRRLVYAFLGKYFDEDDANF